MTRVAFFISLLCMLPACGTQGPHCVNAVDKSISSRQGILLCSGQPFTGMVYSLYAPGDTEYVKTYRLGKLQGVARGWYANGQLKYIYHYWDDVFDGEVCEYFPNGQLYRIFHYCNGQEEGMQTMYWDNGKLRANYESKNGRKYGFTGIKNCTSPWSDSLGHAYGAGM